MIRKVGGDFPKKIMCKQANNKTRSETPEFRSLGQHLSPLREFSPYLVLARFTVRITILMAFAAFGSIGFGNSLAVLLAMSTILCAVVASIRREAIFSRTLNHWDEAMAYAALYFASIGLGLANPV